MNLGENLQQHCLLTLTFSEDSHSWASCCIMNLPAIVLLCMYKYACLCSRKMNKCTKFCNQWCRCFLHHIIRWILLLVEKDLELLCKFHRARLQALQAPEPSSVSLFGGLLKPSQGELASSSQARPCKMGKEGWKDLPRALRCCLWPRSMSIARRPSGTWPWPSTGTRSPRCWGPTVPGRARSCACLPPTHTHLGLWFSQTSAHLWDRRPGSFSFLFFV